MQKIISETPKVSQSCVLRSTFARFCISKTGLNFITRFPTHLYPASTFKSVLLPAPEGPNIAVSCPD